MDVESEPAAEQRLGFWDYLRRFVRKPLWHFLSVEGRFRRVYRKNKWRDPESVSGPGSSRAQTAALREALPGLLRELEVRTLLDVPCGDFNWMREVDLPVERYIGGDIVAELVDANAKTFGDEKHSFVRLDLLRDPLPQADLALCRDCLVHFSFADAFRALAALRASGAHHLLITTYTSVERNRDVLTGEWRTLNLQRAPFGFPEPLRLVNERCPDPRYPDKHLGLWAVADLPPGP